MILHRDSFQGHVAMKNEQLLCSLQAPQFHYTSGEAITRWTPFLAFT